MLPSQKCTCRIRALRRYSSSSRMMIRFAGRCLLFAWVVRRLTESYINATNVKCLLYPFARSIHHTRPPYAVLLLSTARKILPRARCSNVARSAAVRRLGMAMGTTLSFEGCDGGASAPPMTPPPPTVTAGISPTFAALAATSQIQQFTTTVHRLSPS